MSTTSAYNHTCNILLANDMIAANMRLMLCTSSTFNAADETLANIVKVEVAQGNGYLTNGKSVSGSDTAVVNTNWAKFFASTVSWTVSSGSISANSAILYLDSGSLPPLLHINFGGTVTVSAGSDFTVEWNPSGIILLALVT